MNLRYLSRRRRRQDDTPIFEITTFFAAPDETEKVKVEIHPFGGGYGYGGPPPPGRMVSRVLAQPYVEGHTIPVLSEAGTTIRINSEVIIDAIHAISPSYPDLMFDGDALIIPEPFCILLHLREDIMAHRDTLADRKSAQVAQEKSLFESSSSRNSITAPETQSENMKSQNPTSEAAGHITMLYECLDAKYLEDMKQEKLRWTQPDPACTYEWAWLLFSPGTLVYKPTSVDGQLGKAFLVRSFSLEGLFAPHNPQQGINIPRVNPVRLDPTRSSKAGNHLQSISLNLTSLKHDGRNWVPENQTFRIRPFNGEKLITDLPVFPAKYFHDANDSFTNRMITRGRRYHSLSARRQYEYHGEILSGTRRQLHGRIMVDLETYTEYYLKSLQSQAPQPPVPQQYIPDEHSRSNSPVGDDDIDVTAPPGQQYFNTMPDGRGFDQFGQPLNTHLRPQHGFPQSLPLLRSLRSVNADLGKDSDQIHMICDRVLWALVLQEQEWGECFRVLCMHFDGRGAISLVFSLVACEFSLSSLNANKYI